MKKQKFILYVCFCISVAFAGCSGKNKDTENRQQQEVKAQYQCPMGCSGKYDKPGKCPVCGMELEKVANS